MNFFVVEFTHLVVITKHKVMSHCVLLLSSNASVIKHYFFVFFIVTFCILEKCSHKFATAGKLMNATFKKQKTRFNKFFG